MRWYEKSGVQAAIVSAIAIVVAALIGLYSNKPHEHDVARGSMTSQEGGIVSEVEPHANNSIEASNNKIYAARGLPQRLRLRAGLELLPAADSGLASDQVPSGIYAFAHPMILDHGAGQMLRVPQYGRMSFEVQKKAGKLFAVVFVNADEERNLALTNSVTDRMTLYSDFWEDAKHAVLVDPSSCHGDARFVTLDDGSYISAVDCRLGAGTSTKQK